MSPTLPHTGPHSDATVSLGDLLRLRDVVASDASVRELGITFEIHDGRAVAYQHAMRLVVLDGVQVSQALLLVALNQEVERRSRVFEAQLQAGDAGTFQRLEELSSWAPPGYNPKATCLHLMALAASAGLHATVEHDPGDARRECFVVRYAQADGTPTALTTTVWMTGKAVTAVGEFRMAGGFATAWPESQSRDFAAGVAVLRGTADVVVASHDHGESYGETPTVRSAKG